MDVFGSGFLSDESIQSLVKSSVPAILSPSPSESSEDPISKRLRDASPECSVLLRQLESLESLEASFRTGDELQKSAVFLDQRRNDLLRSALVNALQRLRLLMREVESCRSQVHQLSREQATLQQQLEHPAVPEDQISPLPEPSIRKSRGESPLAPGLSPPAGEPGEESARPAKAVKALEAQVAERGTRIVELEARSAALEETVETLKRERGALREAMEGLKERAAAAEGLRRKERESVFRAVEGDVARAEASRSAAATLLKRTEERLESDRRQWEAEKEAMRSAREAAEQTAKQWKLERDGFEGKLKRRKLFAEVIGEVEGVSSKLRRVIKEFGRDGGDSEAHIRVLKEQVRDLGDAFKACDGALHKTKKLVEFGDKKNDQLLNDCMKLQKTVEDQRGEIDREKEAQTKLQRENAALTAELDRLREAAKQNEEAMASVREEAENVKKTALELVGEEESYRQMWKRSERKREELEKRVEELLEANRGLKMAGMRDRRRFVGRSIGILRVGGATAVDEGRGRERGGERDAGGDEAVQGGADVSAVQSRKGIGV